MAQLSFKKVGKFIQKFDHLFQKFVQLTADTLYHSWIMNQSETILQTNIMGAIVGINVVYKAMKKCSRDSQIAAVSSVCGLFNLSILLSYGALKAAFLSYCHDLRAFGKDDHITVNTITPVYITTAITQSSSRKNKHLYLTADYFSQQVKIALENNMPLISLPLHQ
ncbi:uncharacterized protein BX663DRAFT_555171 [Cokeromyces recurvatus]|uniref:uncharacterized protein n=1 Tax=Cokeromyces recurvatus TaxID=90255 RepID=UPI002221082B|nr:uncharacterized protein BX663DRAFT_555171 [Cokeromyces recurvatus]KAI7899313.1 hypothetical protein BX663DRAFT_555171 [Cokeromyces recurvatus]